MKPLLRSRLRRWGLFLLSITVTYLAASRDWCALRRDARPTVQASISAKGKLYAGAGRQELTPPFPIAAAGYGPFRPRAHGAQAPLFARALVLQVDELRIGVVAVDLLTPPSPAMHEVHKAVQDLGLSELWVVATHTHSSMGSYEPDALFQLSGVGPYREAARAALVHAITGALQEAASSLVPAILETGEGEAPELVSSRNQDEPQVDARITRAVFRSAQKKIAEVTIFSAHPTLFPRTVEALSPDYPGHYSRLIEEAEGGVTLFWQGAVGNARSRLAQPDGPAVAHAVQFATRLAHVVRGIRLQSWESPGLSFIRMKVPLPAADTRRLVPGFLVGVGNNLLCWNAPAEAGVSLLALGPLRLLSIPGEATFSAGRELEEATHATRTVSLVNGYIGYMDSSEHVENAGGESRLQYFGPELLDTFIRAATLTREESRQ